MLDSTAVIGAPPRSGSSRAKGAREGKSVDRVESVCRPGSPATRSGESRNARSIDLRIFTGFPGAGVAGPGRKSCHSFLQGWVYGLRRLAGFCGVCGTSVGITAGAGVGRIVVSDRVPNGSMFLVDTLIAGLAVHPNSPASCM